MAISPGALFSTIDETMLIVGQKAAVLSTKLTALGMGSVAGIVGIVMAWYVFTMIVDDDLHGVLGKVANLLFTASLVTVILMNWGNVLLMMRDGIDGLTSSASSATGIGGKNAFDGAMSQFAKASSLLVYGPYADFTSKVWGVLVAVFVVLTALGFVILYNVGNILLYVMIFLGPVFLPFYLIRPISFMADGAVRMIITAAIYKLAGWALAAVAVPGITQITSSIVMMKNTMHNGEIINPGVSFAVILFWCMILMYLTAKMPEIASGIAGGRSVGPRLSLPGASRRMGRSNDDAPERVSS